MKPMSSIVAFLLLLTACAGCDNNEEAFSDPAFKACVVNRLQQYSSIYGKEYNIENDKDLEIIGMMGCTGGGIASIKGVEKLINIKELGLTTNQIEAIEPLRQLKKLEVLHLDSNRIKDIEPLSGAEKLRTLILTNNYISDFRPLKTLSQLKSLGVALNCAIDLSQFDEIKESIPEITMAGITAEEQSPEKCQ